MDPRRREIETLEAEIARLEQQVNAECVALGREIASRDRSERRHPELLKYLASIETLNRSVGAYRADIARIREGVRRISELARSAADNERRAREAAAERDARFPEIGAGSWALYQKLADREPYRQIFEDVAKMEVEGDQIARDLKELEEGERRGWLDRIKTYGRKVSKRSALGRIEKQKQHALAHAGARIAETDFARHASGDLRLALDFSADKRRAVDGFLAEAKAQHEEARRLVEGLRALGVHEDAEDKVRDFEKRIADVQRELDVMYCWTGQLFLEKDLRSELADSALSAKYEVVNELRGKIVRKRATIDRRRAELEVEELAKKDKALLQKRRQLEDELRVKERQIAVVDLEIANGHRRIDELKRVLAGEAPYKEELPMPTPPDFYRKPP